jgi:P4 family phage/plasmid primase-like protien
MGKQHADGTHSKVESRESNSTRTESITNKRLERLKLDDLASEIKQLSDRLNASEGASEDDRWPPARVGGLINAENAFAQDAGSKLYVFHDRHYQPRGEEWIRQRVKDLVPGPFWSSGLANQAIEYIRLGSLPLWERPPLDKLNLLNGLLNLKTLKFEERTPSYLSAMRLPVCYNPRAHCPAWEKQVAETFPDDSVEAGVPWEIIAWLMIPYTDLQKALLLLGPGGTGKSTFLAGLCNFLGRRNVSSLSLHKIETDRFAAARLIGKLANICADLPSTHLESSAMFKTITGGDQITAEYKYKDSFEYTPFSRLIFSANQPPRSKDATEAFCGRWYILSFDSVFRNTSRERRRHEIDAILSGRDEMSGVLNKALVVLPRVLERGLTVTDSMRKAHAEFWRATDPLSAWLSRNTVDDGAAFVAKGRLIESYNAAVAREGGSVMTETALGLSLQRIRPNITSAQRTVDGTKRWCYVGIRMLRDVSPETQ